MEFHGEFRVPGAPADVLTRFADVERMARCMPGASIDGRDEEGSYVGAMVIAFGPKQIRFKGKARATSDPEGLAGGLHIRGAADIKTTARVELRVSYTLHADPAAAKPTTVVKLATDAQIGGVLADFARTGGVVVTQALMEQFALGVAAEFARDSPPAPGNAEASERGPPVAALSAHALLWRALKIKIAAIWRGIAGRTSEGPTRS